MMVLHSNKQEKLIFQEIMNRKMDLLADLKTWF